MKLLLDASFPEFAPAQLTLPGWEVERLEAGGLTDVAMIGYAADHGFHAVVFLGRHAVARPELEQEARRHQMSVVVTTSMHPIDSVGHLRRNLARLRKALPAERPVMVSHDTVTETDWRAEVSSS